MASTSSSSHFIPTSSFQSWKYDVFLSFRGEDTRKTFVAHLYSALELQGIHTYKDDKTLPQGSVIGPSLLQAIRESRIAIIVLSENYAESSWCLDELAHIMECADEIGQTIMPVFYDVDPSDVRKQKGKYGKAFVKFELENNYNVESWRKALTKVGNLSDWVLENIANGDEAVCIKRIVGEISSRLSSSISINSEDLVGIETRLQDLKLKLEIGLAGVRIVGILGVGGGGKTTLATSIYTEISTQFERRCFLENVREESSKQGLTKLQEQLLSRILETKSLVVESVEGGRAMIKRSLCHKKVLVVLDDVDDVDQLEALAGSCDWFGEGSRLIITTRNGHVLTRNANAIYSVNLLSDSEARVLFLRHAYREGKPVEDYGSLSRDLISYCDGLLLALKILGSFLYDKDKDEWISALAKLKDVPNSKIMDKLRISYDGLEPKQKELFLDIACLFCQDEVHFAMPILDAFGFNHVIELKVMAQKSLITVSDGMFHMHDLVKEMAHYMVRGEHPRHPEEHTRVWRQEDVANICAMGTTKENHKIEALVTRGEISNLSQVVANLKNRRCHKCTFTQPSQNFFYLSHENHKIEALGTCDEISNLPQVVANMKNLRYLFWENSKSLLPRSFQPTRLLCLVLKCGSQKQLWEGCKLLPNLKILDLSSSQQLIRTPDFEGLPCLERLILKGCWDLKEIHPSIGYLKRLVLLDMRECKSLERFPPIIQMRKLETLNFCGCISLKKFPEIRMSMDKLVELCLERSAIEIIPSSIGKYCTNLQSINLYWCQNLKAIEGNFQLLKRLKNLDLGGCHKLEKLTEDFFGVECRLEVLDLSYTCSEREYYEEEASVSSKNCFMNCFGFPHRDSFSMRFPHRDSFSMRFSEFPSLLKKLNLNGCKLGDGDIPSGIFELLNLQILRLSNNSFSKLPSLSQLQCLKWLNLDDCDELVEFPDLPSSIAILHASGCSSLEQVGDLSIYKCLWKFSFEGCDKLRGWESGTRYLLQESVVRNSFMSVTVPFHFRSEEEENRDEESEDDENRDEESEDEEGGKYRLRLPEKWYNNFNFCLLCLGDERYSEDEESDDEESEYEECEYEESGDEESEDQEEKKETCIVESQPDEWRELDKNLSKGDEYGQGNT